MRPQGKLELAWGSPGLQGGQHSLVFKLLGTEVPLGAVEELRTEWGLWARSSLCSGGKERDNCSWEESFACWCVDGLAW